MKPDYDSLINAGLSKEEIAKISGCEDQEMQIRMLRKYRYKLLDAWSGSRSIYGCNSRNDAFCGVTSLLSVYYALWS